MARRTVAEAFLIVRQPLFQLLFFCLVIAGQQRQVVFAAEADDRQPTSPPECRGPLASRPRAVALSAETLYDACDWSGRSWGALVLFGCMKPQKISQQFAIIFDLAVRLREASESDALLVMLDGPTDWEQFKLRAGTEKILVAAGSAESLEAAKAAGLETTLLEIHDAPVFERLTQALLKSVADEKLAPSANVVAIYSGFEAGSIDSLSFIRLDEHLGRLTARDLRQIETSVPLDTLKAVVDLAVDIGREGREGKPVGTMFVVGDTRRVLAHSHPAGFDAVKGHSRKERNVHDPRARESIKEVAQLDGAFVVTPDGTVEKACQIVNAPHESLTLSKGLGSRHWAAAAISKCTSAIAVVVSQSTGTVRLFKNGEVILRVEPFRRAMKWKDFEYEPPPPPSD